MAQNNLPTAALAQQRSAQAARASKARPQAGVQGAPQNRAARRATARTAGRQPAASTPYKPAGARTERAAPALSAGAALAQAPAVLARDVRETVQAVRNDMADVPFFPIRRMKVAFPLLVVFAVLMVAWWNIVGANPAWAAPLKGHAPNITAFLTAGFFLGLLGVSARSYLPAIVSVVVALISALFGDKHGLFGPGILVAGVLGLAWVVGPLPGLGGKLWRRKKS